MTPVRTADGSLELCATKDDLLSVIRNWTEMKTREEIEQHRVRWNLAGSVFFAITVVTTIGEFMTGRIAALARCGLALQKE